MWPVLCQFIIWTSAGMLLIGPLRKTSIKSESKYSNSSTRKWKWKYHVQNDDHFVSFSICQEVLIREYINKHAQFVLHIVVLGTYRWDRKILMLSILSSVHAWKTDKATAFNAYLADKEIDMATILCPKSYYHISHVACPKYFKYVYVRGFQILNSYHGDSPSFIQIFGWYSICANFNTLRAEHIQSYSWNLFSHWDKTVAISQTFSNAISLNENV